MSNLKLQNIHFLIVGLMAVYVLVSIALHVFSYVNDKKYEAKLVAEYISATHRAIKAAKSGGTVYFPDVDLVCAPEGRAYQYHGEGNALCIPLAEASEEIYDLKPTPRGAFIGGDGSRWGVFYKIGGEENEVTVSLSSYQAEIDGKVYTFHINRNLKISELKPHVQDLVRERTAHR